jgi:hypothetical protein
MLINNRGQKHAKPTTSHGKTVAFGGNLVTF